MSAPGPARPVLLVAEGGVPFDVRYSDPFAAFLDLMEVVEALCPRMAGAGASGRLGVSVVGAPNLHRMRLRASRAAIPIPSQTMGRAHVCTAMV